MTVVTKCGCALILFQVWPSVLFKLLLMIDFYCRARMNGVVAL